MMEYSVDVEVKPFRNDVQLECNDFMYLTKISDPGTIECVAVKDRLWYIVKAPCPGELLDSPARLIRIWSSTTLIKDM